MQWRSIGPFRGGRVTGVAGVTSDPTTYYFGTPGGGVWKTTDAGHVWKPIFDKVPIASIGAVTVAESDPKTIYVGTGEQTRGNGVYKSTDSGATWVHAGLESTRFIQSIVVDPRNPDIAIAGANSLGFQVLWQPLPQSATTVDRGVYKTVDGGRTWKKTLTRDDTLGVFDLEADPNDPRVLYAVLMHAGAGKGDSAIPQTSEAVKSMDQGTTWQPLKLEGIPGKDRGRMGIAVAPGNAGKRLYAVVKQGFYRSDDGGATWRKSTKDPRILGSAYFSRIFVDTKNPDVLYVSQTSLYRSTDGGVTFESYVGAPSGDDFHVLWIDPANPSRMLLGVDQGAIVSVDAGHSWSSWYNQPTGQFYHVSTDDRFPYRIYAPQQDSGTAGILSRSDYGEITERDWTPIGGFEFGFIVPDPVNPDIVFSAGWYGSVAKFDRSTGQVATVFEKGEKYRTAQMAPLAFSPQDPHTLFMGAQFVMKTSDSGMTWQTISPDLTLGVKDEDKDADSSKPPPPAISALSLSTLPTGVIWVGTTDRQLHVSRDHGASWQNVTLAGLDKPLQILTLEASYYDEGAAYAVAGATRESTAPYVFRTRDFGKTWTKIVSGLPNDEMIRVVREDPIRKGLLYAGTDTGVYFSIDDGDSWTSLQLNLPTVVITDLTIHGGDLIAATYGRSLWILDNVSPIRQLNTSASEAPLHILKPEPAIRVRWDNNEDTPLPPEVPAGFNPPDGAIIDYVLNHAPDYDITMRILDAGGHEIRQFSSHAELPKVSPANVPDYWFSPLEALPKKEGLNRFVWDLRYAPPTALPYAYTGDLLEYTEFTLADHAIPGNTPRVFPLGPLVTPGVYTIEITMGGKTYTEPLTVKMDPRVHASEADLHAQLELSQAVTRGMEISSRAYRQVAELKAALGRLPKNKLIDDAAALIVKKVEALEKGPRIAPGFGPVNRDLARFFSGIQSADARPGETTRSAVEAKCKALDAALLNWKDLNAEKLPKLNDLLRKNKRQALPVVSVDSSGGCRLGS